MSPFEPARRRFLRAVVAAGTAALAGCSIEGNAGRAPTVTPAPVPTDTSTRTAVTLPPPPSTDDFSFDVSTLNGFTDSLPARINATFRNTGARPLTGVGSRQHVLPFVDDDYAGIDGSGRLGLFLAPADSSLVGDPGETLNGSVGAYHPEKPPDGCWTLPFAWSGARGASPVVRYAVTVPPGEAVSHAYELYFIGDCAPGRFTFESTFDLTNTDPPMAAALYRTRLGFDLAITPDDTLEVAVHDPSLETS